MLGETTHLFRFGRTTILATAAALIFSAALAAAALGAGNSASAGTVVRTHKTSLGTILVDARGRTLYMFMKDKRNKSSCSGAVRDELAAADHERQADCRDGSEGVAARPAMRSDGRMQVTYNGHPLYRFSLDSRAGPDEGRGCQRIRRLLVRRFARRGEGHVGLGRRWLGAAVLRRRRRLRRRHDRRLTGVRQPKAEKAATRSCRPRPRIRADDRCPNGRYVQARSSPRAVDPALGPSASFSSKSGLLALFRAPSVRRRVLEPVERRIIEGGRVFDRLDVGEHGGMREGRADVGLDARE